MKKKVNLYFDETIWEAFRIACIQHHVSGSHMLVLLMTAQLEMWQKEKEQHPHE